MTKVLITGMSGTGKSAALRLLGERGHRTVDTDYGPWNHWVTGEDGEREWVWREDAIADLLAGHREGGLFVSGCTSNQVTFYPDFDHIVLLSAPADVILARVAARTDNPYGKRPEERQEILDNLAMIEPLLRTGATLEIDTRAPLDEVVARLEALTRAK
ncbi:AAA family ATPase [Nonomuraea endophytica]|uniref:Dephospho-CoA kinase n=1 Tax=Nonomuraea endophytica TaxID=714136 RepID=A0A7W8EGF7_9ACTN|nr:AAA family ATPase [Nonomuraea endophytica]MBB5077502.1 dephospho-CoA kinase [Nonomuraea endophytica]